MTTEQEHFTPPRAAAILREIVRAFEMQHPALTDKTAQRYFSNGEVSEEARSYILMAFCEELSDRRLFPDPIGDETSRANREEVVNILFYHVERFVADWESLLSSLRSVAPKVDKSDLAIFAITRPLTIDLSLRNAGLLTVQKDDSDFGAPPWAVKHGLRDALRDLQRACDIDSLPRAFIAELLAVDRHTVDNWFDGKSIPTRVHLRNIAKAFAEFTKDSNQTDFERYLARIAGLTRLATKLRESIGDGRFEQLVEQYVNYTQKSVRLLRPSPLRIEPPVVDPGRLMLWGCELESSDYLLSDLHESEDDPVWKTELRFASKPLFIRLIQVFHAINRHRVTSEFVESRFEENSAQTEKIVDRLNELGQANLLIENIDADVPPETQTYLVEMAINEDEPKVSISHLRKLIDEYPGVARYHQHLGFALEQDEQIEEAVVEYRTALQLDPSDPGPLIDIGMAEYSSGHIDVAIEYLKRAVQEVGDNNELLNLFYGMALRESGDFESSLGVFEKIFENDSGNAWAADWAAESAFKTGDRIKGQRYAKIGWRSGQDSTFNEWRTKQI